MLISERFEGSRAPFEGNRLLMLRSLPEGAQVTNTTVTLTPVSPPGDALFEERITFQGTQGEWGARLRESTEEDDPCFVEVDFHARRTLSNVTGSNLNGAKLQVDIGGLYVSINKLGAMATPGDMSDEFTLPSSTGGTLPALATQKFKLTKSSQPQITEVSIRSAPSNLTLRLGSQPPFWARPGELAQPETTPDFSVILNAFLAEAQAQDGYYELPLTLHSDSLCRLDMDVTIEFVQKQTALPDGLTETVLSFDHSTLPQGEAGVISVQLPPGARVLAGQTTARVRGSFANSRVVYGPTGKVDAAGVVNVTSERAQASPIIFSESVALSSLDLLLTSTSRTAELAVDLVEDLDGKPGTQSTLPAQVEVGIDSQIAGKPTWVNAALPVEVQVKAGTRIWLVVQSLTGEAAWSVVTQAQVGTGMSDGSWTAGDTVATDQANGTSLGILYTNTGGLAWRTETTTGISEPLAGMVHLRQPAAGYQVPIVLQVGDGGAAQRVSLDRFQPLGRVDFNLDFAEFAEAINQAASTGAVNIPPVGEHLLNNELEDWRRVGDTPQGLTSKILATDESVFAVAASPSGHRLYVVQTVAEHPDDSCLVVYQTPCHQLEEVIPLGILGEGVCFIAISPNGARACIIYNSRLIWIDLENPVVVGSFMDEGMIYPSKPLFSPDGGRLYAISLNQLKILIVDVNSLENELLATDGQISNAVVGAIDIRQSNPADATSNAVVQALSPDGHRLYMVVIYPDSEQPPELQIYDTELGDLVQAIPLRTDNSEDYALALNPDETRLAVACAQQPFVEVYETRRWQLLGEIALAIKDKGGVEHVAFPMAVGVDPAGRWTYVVVGSSELSVGAIVRFDLEHLSIGAVHLSDIGPSSSDLVILPDGSRLYVPDEIITKEYVLYMLNLGAMIPEEWSLTAGKIQPVCLDEPFHRGAVLGDFVTSSSGSSMAPGAIPTFMITAVEKDQWVEIQTDNFPADDYFTVTMGPMGSKGINGIVIGITYSGQGGRFTMKYDIPPALKGSNKIAIRLESPTSDYYAYNWFYNNSTPTLLSTSTRTFLPSAISQVIPVVGGVSYDLSFWGLATSQEVLAEVIWYGADCGVQQTDRIPFHDTDDPETLKCTLQALIEIMTKPDMESFSPISHRLAMISPEGAEQAEVRFTAPVKEAAFLDRVSLQATANTLSNGDLQHIEDSKLVGWVLVPSVVGAILAEEADGLRFRNASGQDVALEQTTVFSAQVPFEVKFSGRGEASGSGAEPRVEVVWQDADGARVGNPIAIQLTAEASDRAARRGESPLGTVSALVRVVVPVGADLLLQSIQLEEVKMTTVPIYIIAQAPGDIQVSGMQVVYEVKPPTPPKTLPPGGLCTPTPPPGMPEKRKRGCCYCPNCGETDDLCDVAEMETVGGQPALEGECCHCGARVQQIGGTGTSLSVPKDAAPVVVRGTGMVRGQTMIRANAVRAMEVLRANVTTVSVDAAIASPATTQPEHPNLATSNTVEEPVKLPPITEVTRVTQEIAEALTVGGIGTLDQLAKAAPSEIAVVLPENLKAEAKYISRNSRNLLKRVQESG